MTLHTEVQPTARWVRTSGLRDLGCAQGSGLNAQRYLVQRADGQVLQLSELLHLVVREVSIDRDPVQTAAAVSTAYGRQLTVEGLQHLVESKLAPMGLVVNSDNDGSPIHVQQPQSDPLLSLRLRSTLLSERAVRRLAPVLAQLFRPMLVILALAGLVTADIAVFRQGSVMRALDQVFATPTFLLALMGLLLAGALIHELGHAAACHYGGAKPGKIGVGVYLVFPAFFTNVTDSYRLDRIGRIRTDLGGLYFNVWCLLALDGAYLWSGQSLLLLTALLMHVEMAQQLIPTVRFDGYFVLADLAGVPDLFARVRPVLLSLIPGHATDPRVSELRPAARRLVTAWVLLVVPTLLAGFGWLAYSSPYLIRKTISGVRTQSEVVRTAWHSHDLAPMALAAISIVLLVLPMLGLLILLQRVVFGIFGAARRRFFPARTAGFPTRTAGDEITVASLAERLGIAAMPPHIAATPITSPVTVASIALREGLSAASFTDAEMLRAPNGPAPESGWRRAIYRVTSGAINPGPSAEQARQAATLARVTAPISGSRRVVVMSRKGGVGKTTITLALGSMFAMLRGDRVIAVDANPDAGNLAHRVTTPSDRTITDVLRSIDQISSYADLRAFTAQSTESRLEVLASDDDPKIGLALNRRAYHQVIQLLDHYYNLILLDTGTGILDSANQGLLTEADQLVIVLRPALDGARAAALTLDWLSEHGYGELVARAVVVINASRRKMGIPIDRIEDHFARRCAKVVSVPWDPALETGAQTGLSHLRPETRNALVELSAAVADNFAAPDVIRAQAAEHNLAP
jgi:putative peptide zinc metalloprotease protein